MKCNAKKLCLLIMMSAATGLWMPERGRAQEPNVNRPYNKAMPSIQPAPGGQQPSGRQHPTYANDPFNSSWSSITSGREATKVTTAVRKAAEAVRDAKGDDAKSVAQKKLTDLLNKSYDENMAQRERELKQIEERFTKLRELLSRRRSKKREIIDLQIKVALNDADGLGFYDSERPAKSGGAIYYAPVQPTINSYPPPVSGNSNDFSPIVSTPGTPSAEPFAEPTPSSDPEPLTPTPSR
jgi:hypothetical protein